MEQQMATDINTYIDDLRHWHLGDDAPTKKPKKKGAKTALLGSKLEGSVNISSSKICHGHHIKNTHVALLFVRDVGTCDRGCFLRNFGFPETTDDLFDAGGSNALLSSVRRRVWKSSLSLSRTCHSRPKAS